MILNIWRADTHAIKHENRDRNPPHVHNHNLLSRFAVTRSRQILSAAQQKRTRRQQGRSHVPGPAAMQQHRHLPRMVIGLSGMDPQGAAVPECLPFQQGTIMVLFEKDFRGVRPALLTLNRQYQEIIHTSFSAQMDGELGIEIILVRGGNLRIRSLERELMGKRGVRSVRLTLIPS